MTRIFNPSLATPGGSDTEVQFNDGGVFGGNSAFTFNKTTGQLALSTTGSGAGIVLGGDVNLYRDTANVLRTDDSVRAPSYNVAAPSSFYGHNWTSINTASGAQLTFHLSTSMTGAVNSDVANFNSNLSISSAGAGGLVRSIRGGITYGGAGLLTGLYALEHDVTYNGTTAQLAGVIAGVYAGATINGTVTEFLSLPIGTLAGVYAYLTRSSGTSDITYQALFYGLDTGGAVAGDHKAGMWIQFAATTTQTVTNQYGIYITDVAYGTNKYGMYFAGNGVNNAITWNAGAVNIYGSTATLVTDNAMLIRGNLTIGAGGAGVDYTLTFDGETNNGVMTWREDEKQFRFDSPIDLATGSTAETMVLGSGTTGVDYSVRFNGRFNDGTITWMDDENYFSFSDTIKLNRRVIRSKSTYTGTDTTDDIYIHKCNSASAFTLTVLDGGYDGEEIIIYNINTGVVTLSGNISTITATSTLDQGESLVLRWDSTDSEWQ